MREAVAMACFEAVPKRELSISKQRRAVEGPAAQMKRQLEEQMAVLLDRHGDAFKCHIGHSACVKAVP